MLIKYLKVTTNGSNVNDGNYWYKITIISAAGTNVSQNIVPTTNGTVSSEGAGTINCITNSSGGYCALGVGSIWVKIELPNITDCDYVTLLPYYNDHRAYNNLTVEVSIDNTNWTTIYAGQSPIKTSNEPFVVNLDPTSYGIRYNNSILPQKFNSNYFKYNNTDIYKAYYNGKLIWQRITTDRILPYTFANDTVTSYTGGGTSISIPTGYSIIYEPTQRNLIYDYNDFPDRYKNYNDIYFASGYSTVTYARPEEIQKDLPYIFSASVVTRSSGSNIKVKLTYMDDTTEEFSSGSLPANGNRFSISFTPAHNIKYLQLVSSSTSNEIEKIQLEQGSSLTAYEAPTKYFIKGLDYVVKKIGNSFIKNNTSIESVTLNPNIISIGQEAFYGCYYLNTLIISDYLTSIGSKAFMYTALWDGQQIPSYVWYKVSSIGVDALATTTNWLIKIDAQTEVDNSTSSFASYNLGNKFYAPGGFSNTDGTLTSENNRIANTHLYYLDTQYISIELYHNGGTNDASGTMYIDSLIVNYGDGATLDLGISGNHTYSSLGNGSASPSTIRARYQVVFNGKGTTRPTLTFNRHTSLNNWSSTTKDNIHLQRPIGIIASTYAYGNEGSTFETCTDYNNTYKLATHSIDWDYEYVTTCLVKGTLITLANGERKPIEDIKYTDLLKVWNFETGQIDYQYPLMLAESHTNLITRITLEDDSYIEISGVHDIYDPNLHKFVAWGNGNIPDSEVKSHTMLKLIDNEYQILKVKSLETIEKDTTCYCCMTGGTITAFANNILVGSVLLNYAGIEKTNSFSKSFANDKQVCYTYNKFKEELYDKSDKYSILGLNLHYAHFYNKDVSNLPQLLAPFEIKKPLNIVNNKIQCTIGFLQGDTLTEQTIPEDTVITMPEIADPDKNKWYVVGEYKYLNPGDSYTINYSTIIRAVKGENNDS